MEIDQSNIARIRSGVGATPRVSQQRQAEPPTCQLIDWFHEGDERDVQIGALRVTIRFVGRKGRRARIAITAPTGVVFRSVEKGKNETF